MLYCIIRPGAASHDLTRPCRCSSPEAKLFKSPAHLYSLKKVDVTIGTSVRLLARNLKFSNILRCIEDLRSFQIKA